MVSVGVVVNVMVGVGVGKSVGAVNVPLELNVWTV